LPLLILNKFTEKDGSVGKLVLVEPTLTNSTWGPTEIEGLVHAMRDTVDQVSFNNIPPMPTMPIAGNLTVTSDLLEAVSEDGPRATLFAFIAVVSLVVIIFRKPSVVFLMLFALVLGNIWMFGIIIACGLKINFLNFIALPITFGIGVDYGVNIFHRYRHEPTKDILKVVRETGGAVGLCSLTTIAGYSSLLIAGNQAFVSFGRLAVLGEVTSLFAAIITLPALLLVSNRLFEAKYRQNFDLNY
jgi:predicted RND superfamily exporter protein